MFKITQAGTITAAKMMKFDPIMGMALFNPIMKKIKAHILASDVKIEGNPQKSQELTNEIHQFISQNKIFT